MIIEWRQALISYQDYHMLCLTSGDRPLFRTRITTCYCSFSQVSTPVVSVANDTVTLSGVPVCAWDRVYLIKKFRGVREVHGYADRLSLRAGSAVTVRAPVRVHKHHAHPLASIITS